MIVVILKKPGLIGKKPGSYPRKTKLHREKTKFTYDLLYFMTCLSIIIENDVHFGMIRFRKFFEMIFHFGNVPHSKNLGV